MYRIICSFNTNSLFCCLCFVKSFPLSFLTFHKYSLTVFITVKEEKQEVPELCSPLLSASYWNASQIFPAPLFNYLDTYIILLSVDSVIYTYLNHEDCIPVTCLGFCRHKHRCPRWLSSCSCRYIKVPMGNMGVFDPTEIHNRGLLKSHMKEAMIKLGYHLLCFFIYLYR